MKKTLENWLSEGRLRRLDSSRQEISDLLGVVDRDLKDADIEQLSTDRRFATAYNAVLQLASITLRACGYRTRGAGHHWITFQMLPLVMGDDQQDRADYFNACRTKRNDADYDASGEISDAEVEELIAEAKQFRTVVLGWLESNQGELAKGLR